MRIVRSERVILSQNENDIWIEFGSILSGLARGTEKNNTKKMIIEIQRLLANLWDKTEVEA